LALTFLELICCHGLLLQASLPSQTVKLKRQRQAGVADTLMLNMKPYLEYQATHVFLHISSFLVLHACCVGEEWTGKAPFKLVPKNARPFLLLFSVQFNTDKSSVRVIIWRTRSVIVGLDKNH
jgi:hypothetical protein